MPRTRRRSSAVRCLACVLAVTTTWLCSLPPIAEAMLAPARLIEETSGSGPDRAADLRAVQAALETKAVREQLKGLGLSEAEVAQRLGALSDQDLHLLAVHSQATEPGGIVVWLLTVAVLVALLIFLVQRIK